MRHLPKVAMARIGPNCRSEKPGRRKFCLAEIRQRVPVRRIKNKIFWGAAGDPIDEVFVTESGANRVFGPWHKIVFGYPGGNS
jgi:hypothetical protein